MNARLLWFQMWRGGCEPQVRHWQRGEAKRNGTRGQLRGREKAAVRRKWDRSWMGSGQREHPTNIFFCEGDNVLKIFYFFSESGREKPILLMTKQSPLDLMSSRCIARPSLACEVYSVVREVQRSNSQDLESKRTVEWRLFCQLLFSRSRTNRRARSWWSFRRIPQSWEFQSFYKVQLWKNSELAASAMDLFKYAVLQR